MPDPIGILGGSFDPVHCGHLRLAMEAMDMAGLEKILFIPLHQPSHRSPLYATPAQRQAMLALATGDRPGFEVSDIEIRRGGTTYSVDTLRQLQQLYPGRPLCLILGMDAFSRLNHWHEWQAISQLSHILIADRPLTDPTRLEPEVATLLAQAETLDNKDLHSTSAGKIMKIHVPQLDISSSRIRHLLRNGRHPDFLLPGNVLDYINSEQIYPDGDT